MNEASARALGYTVDELLGQFYLRLVHPDDRKQVHDLFYRQLASADPDHFAEFRYIGKNGNSGWFSFLVNPLLSGGRVVGLTGVAQEITDRKRAEVALHQSEEQFRTAFEYSASGMSLTGLDGQLQRVNNRMCEMFGYPKEELTGRHFQSVTHNEDAEIGSEAVRSMVSGEAMSVSFEKRYLRKSGEVFWAYINSALLKDSSGKPQNFITQIEDITERKLAEEKIQKQLEELKRWYDVTSGRELRVIELKREVNDLLKRIGEPTRYATEM